MKDDPVALGAAVGAGIGAAFTGSLFGISLQAMFMGLLGGVVALVLYPAKPAPRQHALRVYLALLASVVVSVIAGGVMGPYHAAMFDIASISDAVELNVFSLLWGAGAQAGLLATAIEALRRRIEGLGGPQP